jgi:methyl-accepting chemotaxis protein
MAENFRSVAASTTMLEALERQDSACLSILFGRVGAEAVLDRERDRFVSGLQAARANITIAVEDVVVSDVERLFLEYRDACDEVFASPVGDAIGIYEEVLFPRFENAKAAVNHLLELNHQAMREADLSARRLASHGSEILGITVALTLLFLGFFYQMLSRNYLDRLAAMNHDVQAITAGDHHRRLESSQDDELGALARQLNATLDARQEGEGTLRGVLTQQRQLLLGLLAHGDTPAALVALDGTLVASTLTDEQGTSLRERELEIRSRRRAALGTHPEDQPESAFLLPWREERSFRFEPLVVNRMRAVGWRVVVIAR